MNILEKETFRQHLREHLRTRCLVITSQRLLLPTKNPQQKRNFDFGRIFPGAESIST